MCSDVVSKDATRDLVGAKPASTKLTLSERVLYGAGECGESIKQQILQTFLLFYYVQIVGLPGMLCGLALFLALLGDGIIDPWIGSWSDRTRHKLGRRHPFIYAAPWPLALSLFLLFSPPQGMDQTYLFAWLLAFSFLARASMTLYYVPHLALGAELSHDYHERLSLSTYRMLFTQIGRVVCLVAAFAVFFLPSADYPNGQLDPSRYQPFAIFCGIMVILFVLPSALGTQRRMLNPNAALRTPAPAEKRANIFLKFARAMKIANFRRLFLALLIMFLFAGTQGVLTVHMNTYFWGFSPQEGQFTFYAQIVGFIVGLPIARPLAEKFDKKWAYCFCVGSSCIALTSPIVVQLTTGALPKGEFATLVAVCLANLAYGTLGASSGVFSAAMLADLADDYELQYGERAEGLFFGAYAFSSKASMGMGGGLAGLMLDFIRFPRPPDGGPPSDQTVQQLGIGYGPILLIVLLAGLSIMFGYDLSRQKHAQIVERISARKQSA